MICFGRSSGCVTLPLAGFMLCGLLTLMLSVGPSGFSAFIVVMLLLAMFGLPILFILSLASSFMTKVRASAPYISDAPIKPKRSMTLDDMMTLLTDEDLDELRQRAKQRIMEQIDGGDVKDVQTFEDLLLNAKQKRK